GRISDRTQQDRIGPGHSLSRFGGKGIAMSRDCCGPYRVLCEVEAQGEPLASGAEDLQPRGDYFRSDPVPGEDRDAE
ncbi:MAG TPA: hypothetical protein VEI47_04780, partial [Gemmatimonadales bacterium]|nr:hypothetical protein [Gemmatimonadales bacterium]